MVMRADLNGSVARIGHLQAYSFSAFVQLEVTGGDLDLARDHFFQAQYSKPAAARPTTSSSPSENSWKCSQPGRPWPGWASTWVAAKKRPAGTNRFMVLLLNDGMVNGDELGAVGKGRLDLDLGNHLGDTFHDLGALEQRRAPAHEILHAATVACAFEDRGADIGHGLGIVELQAPALAPLGEQCGGKDQQLVLLARRELHLRTPN